MKDRLEKAKFSYLEIVILILTLIVNICFLIYLQIGEADVSLLACVIYTVVNFSLIILASYIKFKKIENRNTKVEDLAYKDFETNIYNLNYLNDNYKRYVKNNGVRNCAYITMDIDNFKYVNSVMGYEAGNDIIKIIAETITKSISENELVIRVGGDIFGILMAEGDRESLFLRVDKIIGNINNNIADKYTDRANISFSCGICIIDSIDETVKEIIDKSNIARKAAKNAYNKNIEFFDEKMQEMVKNRIEIEEDMEKALQNKEFIVYFQPKVNMITGKLYGAEALVRWQHQTKGMILPAQFIPVFEENGFILNLDYYMFEAVCQLKKKWADSGKKYPIVSVNMSRLHIYDKNFIYNLVEIAKKYNVPPEELEIEVTENAFFEDSHMLLIFTDDLKRAGFKVSIDDFGSGFSSLNMLKDINADVLKIDRNFLISMDKNHGKGKKILKNIIAMARDLKIDIVTEGVENLKQIELLTDYGCEIAQGFYYAKPMSVEDYEIFASIHGEFIETACLYRFDGTYRDEYDGENVTLVGKGFEFVDGIYEGRKALRLPGGEVSENYILVPPKYLNEENFTISLWLNTGDVFSAWSSLVYAEYETGFMSFMPVAWNGSMSFRIKDNMYTEGWHDNHYPAIIKKNQWYHITLTYNAKLECSRLYVNGEAVGYRGNVPPLRGIKSIYIGGDIYQQSMACIISDLMISDQVKSSSEIRNMYQDIIDKI